jgi:hypothetical protein
VMGHLLQARTRAAPGSPEWKKADEELEKILQSQIQRTPNARHDSRMKALYVEPLEAVGIGQRMLQKPQRVIF